MALRQRRHWRRLGLPEAVAVLLVALLAASGLLWWRGKQVPVYRETHGEVAACDIQLTHYNATNLLRKVAVDYAYSVGLGSFKGHWEGFWPSVESPNALPPDRIEVLREPRHTLVVLYDPSNPARSTLHYPTARGPLVYTILAPLAFLMTVGYCAWVYPTWRGV